MNNRSGYLWGDRFKSVLIEKGEGLLNCLAYIDLNPVRAGIVKRPEDYRWSGIGYRIYTDKKKPMPNLQEKLYEKKTEMFIKPGLT